MAQLVCVKVTPNSYGIHKGSVFGFRKIEKEKDAERYGLPIGAVLALVENELGVSFEIPICDLELM